MCQVGEASGIYLLVLLGQVKSTIGWSNWALLAAGEGECAKPASVADIAELVRGLLAGAAASDGP